MSISQKNNKTKQYIHRVLFFTFDPKLLETSINFCNKNPEEGIKNNNDLKEKIEKEKEIEKEIIVRINNNNFFEKNHYFIKELSFLNLQYEYTKKLSDNLPNNKQNNKSSKNNSINNIQNIKTNTKNNTKTNTRTNKKNYKIKSNILSYKSNILKYLIKYKLPEDVKKDMSESMNLMEDIMKNNNIKNSINENFEKNNIKKIFEILKNNNPYIKYCLIIDEEKSFFSHSIIRREMLSQEGGQSIFEKGRQKASNVVSKILLAPFIFIVCCFISLTFSEENRAYMYSKYKSYKQKMKHYEKTFK
jgi:hypothetical protein